MSPSLEPGQNVFRGARAWLALGLAGLAAAAAVVWFVSGPNAIPLPAASVGVRPPEPVLSNEVSDQVPVPSPAIEKAKPSLAATVTTAPETGEPPTSLTALEQRFHATRVTEDRIAIVREIAGQNDAEAVGTLGRIFPLERHPRIKVALLASLNDIEHDEGLDTRLALLTGALHGQPREVRNTALDSLAQLDDARVLPLLKKAMQDDPDHEVRDLAKALYQAKLEASTR